MSGTISVRALSTTSSRGQQPGPISVALGRDGWNDQHLRSKVKGTVNKPFAQLLQGSCILMVAKASSFVASGPLHRSVVVYMDDHLCCSPSLELHLRDVWEVLAILQQKKKLYINASKCVFGLEELGFLPVTVGHQAWGAACWWTLAKSPPSGFGLPRRPKSICAIIQVTAASSTATPTSLPSSRGCVACTLPCTGVRRKAELRHSEALPRSSTPSTRAAVQCSRWTPARRPFWQSSRSRTTRDI
jgi:hypothetical protein